MCKEYRKCKNESILLQMRMNEDREASNRAWNIFFLIQLELWEMHDSAFFQIYYCIISLDFFCEMAIQLKTFPCKIHVPCTCKKIVAMTCNNSFRVFLLKSKITWTKLIQNVILLNRSLGQSMTSRVDEIELDQI